MSERRGLSTYLARRRLERVEELKAWVRAERRRKREEARQKKEHKA